MVLANRNTHSSTNLSGLIWMTLGDELGTVHLCSFHRLSHLLLEMLGNQNCY